MVVPEREKRATIEEVLQSEFFAEVRNMESAPQLDEVHRRLRDICDDQIKRENVYRYEGKEKYQQYWDETVKVKFEQEENREYWDVKLAHAKACGQLFVFQDDPDAEHLNAIRDKIQAESKAAYAKRKKEEEKEEATENTIKSKKTAPSSKNFVEDKDESKKAESSTAAEDAIKAEKSQSISEKSSSED